MHGPNRSTSLKSAGTVLIVDDVPASLHGLRQLLTAHGYDVLTAQDGEEALAIATREHPDIVLTDVRMPKKDGFEVCRELRAHEQTRLTPVILVTGAAETDDKIRAIDAGASEFLSKPIDISELRVRVRSLVQLKRFTDDLDSAEAVLRSLALTIEARDAYTEGHCERLANYAVALGQRLGLAEEDLLALERGGYFHDIGKIGIPDAILLKKGKLTTAERRVMAPVCQCSSCLPVIRIIGYSASGRSAAGMMSAGTKRALPVAVGKSSMKTTGSPGSPSCRQG